VISVEEGGKGVDNQEVAREYEIKIDVDLNSGKETWGGYLLFTVLFSGVLWNNDGGAR